MDNRAYCAMLLEALSSYQIHALFLENRNLMYKFYKFSGLEPPTLPSMLIWALSDPKPETMSQSDELTFDLNERLCAPLHLIEKVLCDSSNRTSEKTKLVLFKTSDFDRRSRKARFSTVTTLPRDKWQEEIDALLNHVISQLKEGSQELIEIELPVFMEQPSKRKLTGPTNDWSLSYPIIRKGRRMGVWTRLYGSTLTNFCNQYLSAKSSCSENSNFVLQIPDDEFDNPFIQLKMEIISIKGEHATRSAWCCSRAEFLAALLNAITRHQWPALSKAIPILMNLCQECSAELLPLLQKQALILIIANRSDATSSDMIFSATQLLAAKLNAASCPILPEKKKHGNGVLRKGTV